MTLWLYPPVAWPRRIAPAAEAGVWTAAAAGSLLASGVAEDCIRVLVEPGEVHDDMESVVTILCQIEQRIGELAVPVLLHGQDRSAWRCVEIAARRGDHTRVGFEDCLVLPDGWRAENNASMVVAARRIARTALPQ